MAIKEKRKEEREREREREREHHTCPLFLSSSTDRSIDLKRSEEVARSSQGCGAHQNFREDSRYSEENLAMIT